MQELLSVNDLEIVKSPDYRDQLIIWINQLINEDFHALVQALYRIDISENRLKELLNSNANKDAAEIISDLIIDRQLQKIKSRQQFRRDEHIDEDDKW